MTDDQQRSEVTAHFKIQAATGQGRIHFIYLFFYFKLGFLCVTMPEIISPHTRHKNAIALTGENLKLHFKGLYIKSINKYQC